MENNYELLVSKDYSLERIDTFLASAIEIDFSRSRLQKLIKSKNITVNDKETKPNYKIKEDDLIKITIPEVEKIDLEAEDIDIKIVYQDKDIAVIHKPAGLVVHPGAGNYSHTLVNALLFHLKDLSGIGGVERPGIVHRLDKDTEGLMVVAKNDNAHTALVDMFANREIIKEYHAIVNGNPAANAEIQKPIGRHPKYRYKMTVIENGKDAKSSYSLLKKWIKNGSVISLLKVKIFTGRTHQIRVHLSSIGLPIIGDGLYSKKSGKYKTKFFLLAATRLCFKHPVSGEEMDFKIDLPEHFQSFIRGIE